MSTIPTFDETAGAVLADRQAEYMHADLPAEIHERFADLTVAVHRQLGASAQLDADLGELKQRQDLLPVPGYQRLRNEALARAETTHAEALKDAHAAIDGLQAELAAAALPDMPEGREQFGREELALLFGSASGPAAMKRVIDIAQEGSPECIAALLSPFGKSFLRTRGLHGRDFDETMKYAKAVIVKEAKQKGTTAKAVRASILYDQVGQLKNAPTAAGEAFSLRLGNRSVREEIASRSRA